MNADTGDFFLQTFYIRRALREVIRFSGRRLRRLGLTFQRHEVLSALAAASPSSVGKLARATGLGVPSVRRALRELGKIELVRRDRAQVFITLEGQRRLRAARDALSGPDPRTTSLRLVPS